MEHLAISIAALALSKQHMKEGGSYHDMMAILWFIASVVSIVFAGKSFFF